MMIFTNQERSYPVGAPPIMGFKQLPRIPVGADLSRPPPIYRPLLAVPLSRLIYETSLSAPSAPSNIQGKNSLSAYWLSDYVVLPHQCC